MKTTTAMCKRAIWLTCLSLAAVGAIQVVHAADGGLDPAFGVNGLVRTDFAGVQDQANAVAVDATFGPVAGGSTHSFTHQDSRHERTRP